jgi:ubiquinone/menaquinone biosynthesis C-methylase UbiE
MDARIMSHVLKQRDEILDLEYQLVEDAYTALGSNGCRTVDVGCGKFGLLGRMGERLAALQAGSIGIDMNGEALASNPNVTHRVQGSCYSLPLKSGSVDLILCRWMFEHIETPEEIMREFSRVLKKGGFLYIKTPNLWNYAMILSWATPTIFHNVFRSATGLRENTPTFYRANTKRRLTELATNTGFAVRQLESYSNSFMYYSFNKELFLLMRSLSRLVGKVTDSMEQILFCVLEKN